MPKVSIGTPYKARSVAGVEGFAGAAATRAYFDGARDPLHLHLHDLAPCHKLTIGPMAADCAAYVWSGGIAAGGRELAAGSSLIVERGAAIEVTCCAAPTQLLTFAAAHAPASPRAGGHVHLLPAERVPRLDKLGGPGPAGGGIHADSACPTCEVWLHENYFPGGGPLSPEDAAIAIHSHSEEEIIFVTAGAIRLGNRLCGPGTAIAIAADTLYSFAPGPDGLSFVNFRAAMPSDIVFANGSRISETGYWRDRLPRPEYLEPRQLA